MSRYKVEGDMTNCRKWMALRMDGMRMAMQMAKVKVKMRYKACKRLRHGWVGGVPEKPFFLSASLTQKLRRNTNV